MLGRYRMKKKKHIKHGMIITLLIIMIICFCRYENNHIGLTKYQYKTNKLSENKKQNL